MKETRGSYQIDINDAFLRIRNNVKIPHIKPWLGEKWRQKAKKQYLKFRNKVDDDERKSLLPETNKR